MADISLHYSSKAPLAGTFTAFSQILATWRRRAPATAASSPLSTTARCATSASARASIQFEANKPFWRALIFELRSRARFPTLRGPFPLRTTGRRSTLSLPVDRRLFLCLRLCGCRALC